ncbi:hypothetical protein QR680_002918 [Steinernema hermaphroditum]|uniref:Uncharacterized protein n=1 Tax=Steinernema hermaphroditum TaxID=289476 RepID=A0AA39H4L0_9BILA|nr:hypothetical protein QR680_002918 [Steinernema hermaphroditum]
MDGQKKGRDEKEKIGEYLESTSGVTSRLVLPFVVRSMIHCVGQADRPMSSGPDHPQTSNGHNFHYQQPYGSGWQNGASQQSNPAYQPGMMGPSAVPTSNDHSYAPSSSHYMNTMPMSNDPYGPSTSMAHSTPSTAPSYLFTSDMINSAATSVINGKSESIFAWHEQNVHASTSEMHEENGRSLKRKTSSNDSASTPYSNGSASGIRPSSVHDLQNGKAMSSSMDDNPLRKMEKMTQESSLFQPPTKKGNCDYAPAIKDQDRISKLEKLNQMAQTLGAENMGIPVDKRGEHAMMMAPNQKMFIPPQNMQRIPMQPQYAPGHAPVPGPSARGPAPPYFRAPGPPGMVPYHNPGMNGMPPLRPNATPPMMPPHSVGLGMGSACPPPYPFPGPAVPTVNSPSYSTGYVPQPQMSGINSTGGPGFPPPLQNQPIDTMVGFPMNGLPQLASPRFPVPPDGGLPPMMNPQFHGGPMVPPQMPPPSDMYTWQNSGFPQPLTNLDSRVPSQKVQYFPPNGQMPPQCAPPT